MHIPQFDSKESPSKAFGTIAKSMALGGPGALLLAILRLARRKGPAAACGYCGTGLHDDGQNCRNCGAAAPPPMPEPKREGPSTTVWVATIALWSFGGFLGLHCHAARRHLRGLVYLVGFFWIFFVATSIDITATERALNLQAIAGVGLALTLLWAYDGVQIIRGRFIL